MFGAVWAQAELRKVLGALGGRVIEAECEREAQAAGRAKKATAAKWAAAAAITSRWKTSW